MIIRPPLTLTLASAVALATVAPAAQSRQFRAGADTVPVFVTVHDRNGAFVTGLTQEDFELRDNGRVQTITQFTTATLPLSTVVLLDGSGSMMPEFNRAIETARSYVVRMLPEDRTIIGSFADTLRFGPRFTSDRDLLLDYLDDELNLVVGPETHLWEALLESTMVVGEERNRRVILIVSDGWNFVLDGMDSSAPAGPAGPLGRNPITGQPQRIPGRTGPVGGNPSGGGSFRTGPTGDPRHNGVPAGSARSAALVRDVIVYAMSVWVRTEGRSERPSPDLERLAVDTGGSFTRLETSAEVMPTVGRILEELRGQYVLGFTPTAFDGKEHRLEVRVKPRGLTVRARRSYVAARGGRP